MSAHLVFATSNAHKVSELEAILAPAWEGFEVDGHVDTVLARGKVVVDGGEYLGRAGDGRFVKRGLSQYLI